MEKSEGLYLIRDVDWKGERDECEALGTDLRNSETVCKVCWEKGSVAKRLEQST